MKLEAIHDPESVRVKEHLHGALNELLAVWLEVRGHNGVTVDRACEALALSLQEDSARFITESVRKELESRGTDDRKRRPMQPLQWAEQQDL